MEVRKFRRSAAVAKPSRSRYAVMERSGDARSALLSGALRLVEDDTAALRRVCDGLV